MLLPRCFMAGIQELETIRMHRIVMRIHDVDQTLCDVCCTVLRDVHCDRLRVAKLLSDQAVWETSLPLCGKMRGIADEARTESRGLHGLV